MSATTITAKVNNTVSKNRINNIVQQLYSISREFSFNDPNIRHSVDYYIDYAFKLLFYRFLSENLTHYLNKNLQKFYPNFDYTKILDKPDTQITPLFEFYAELGREQTIAKKGFFILPSQLFCNVLKQGENQKDVKEIIKGIFLDISTREMRKEWRNMFLSLNLIYDDSAFKFSDKTEENNKKILEIMEAVSKIPLDDLVEETSDYKIDKILEWRRKTKKEIKKMLK